MSEKLEAALAQIETQLPARQVSGAPVGHSTPFTGDVQTVVHCMTEVYDRIKTGDLKSEALYTHLAQALGEAAVLAPLETDGPQPVGAFPWLQVILLLIQALGEEAPQ